MNGPKYTLHPVDPGDKPFLDEISNYLEARGLDYNEVMGIIPFFRFPMNAHDGNAREWIAKGWAFRIRGMDGEFVDNQYLLRPCNTPAKLYRNYKGVDKEWVCPKFYTIGEGNILHHCGGFDDFRTASVVAIHEKVVSAELCRKVLGIPCLAISGCVGWCKKNVMIPELERVIEIMAPGATLVVMFDGDISANPMIIQSAGRLQGCIKIMRPDIIVKFPHLPDTKHGLGWDDWAVGQGSLLVDVWERALRADGVCVEDAIPLPWLVEHYGVSQKITQHSNQMEQTTDNYLRLLRYPRWAEFHCDINGDIYDSDGYCGDREELFRQYIMWLERSICQGYGSLVSASKARAAFDTWMLQKQVSIPIKLLLDQPPVSLDDARAVARRLLMQGFKHLGPMTTDQAVETVLRMFRDTVARWTNDRSVDVQWIWSLVGPTGCGKSSFSKFLYDGLLDLGYHRQPKGSFNKTHPKPEEEYRKARDCLVMVIDDYNPSGSYARDVENMAYTLVSDRTVMIREPYGRGPVELILHCVWMLSTTDKTKQFIRSSKDTGERRFIVMEIQGTQMVDGTMRVNKDIVKDCGLQLLIWAAHNGAHLIGDATEYSKLYTERYIQAGAGVESVASAVIDWSTIRDMMVKWYRPSTEDHRFVLRTGLIPLFSHDKLSPATVTDLYNLCEECGAVAIGKARVNMGDKDILKDNVHSITNLDEFIQRLQEKL